MKEKYKNLINIIIIIIIMFFLIGSSCRISFPINDNKQIKNNMNNCIYKNYS